MENFMLWLFSIVLVAELVIVIAVAIRLTFDKKKQSDKDIRPWYWIKEKHPTNGKKVELFHYNGNVEKTVWYDYMYYENGFEFIYFWREAE